MNVKKSTEPLIEMADKKMGKFIIRLIFFLVVFGVLLPEEWHQILGVYGDPIAWCAHMVPSIRKVASISPIGDLVEGFFGASFLFMPVFFIVFIRMEVIGLRFKKMMEDKLSNLRSVLIVYFLSVPMTIGLFYVLYDFPVPIQLGKAHTRGQFLLEFMISYRLSMSLIGAFLVAGMVAMFWILTIYIFGPILYFISRKKKNVVN